LGLDLPHHSRSTWGGGDASHVIMAGIEISVNMTNWKTIEIIQYVVLSEIQLERNHHAIQ
jgi:hypothetical protein